MVIAIGSMSLDNKTQKVKKDGSTVWSLVFKDDKGNTLKLSCDESDFENYDPGDVLGFKLIQSQLG